MNGEAETSMAAAYVSERVTEAAQTVFADTMLGRALQRQAAQNGGISLMSAENPFAFTYDAIGNPTSMLGIQLSWSGRQLQQIVDNGKTYSYAYNIDGQRVSKTVNGVTTEYFYNGSILAGQKTGDDVLVFMYDNNGDIFGLTCNGESYYYIKNAQNDVVAIADSNKAIVAKYFYSGYGGVSEITDADGKDISYKAEHIANINPILYRSYYYDAETNFYYLNSRYYSPDLCRFINADGYVQTGQGILSCNMFAYCGNNPIDRTDESGKFFTAAIVVSAVVGGVIGAVTGALNAKRNGESVAAGAIIGGAVGALTGLVCAALPFSPGGVIAGSILCGGISAVGNVANQFYNYRSNQRRNNSNQTISGSTGHSSSNNKSENTLSRESFRVNKKSVIISFASAAIATPVAMGASALVKPAVEGLTNSVIDMTARSIIEGSSSGNVSLIQFAFDIVVEEMTEE